MGQERKEGRGRAGAQDPRRLHRVGDVLGGVLDKMGLTEEIARQGALERWEGVVGDRIAKVTRATAVSGGVLFVRVDSSAWLNELNFMRRDILKRLNAGQTQGRVDRVVFSLAERKGSPDGEDGR